MQKRENLVGNVTIESWKVRASQRLVLIREIVR